MFRGIWQKTAGKLEFQNCEHRQISYVSDGLEDSPTAVGDYSLEKFGAHCGEPFSVRVRNISPDESRITHQLHPARMAPVIDIHCQCMRRHFKSDLERARGAERRWSCNNCAIARRAAAGQATQNQSQGERQGGEGMSAMMSQGTVGLNAYACRSPASSSSPWLSPVRHPPPARTTAIYKLAYFGTALRDRTHCDKTPRPRQGTACSAFPPPAGHRPGPGPACK